MKREIDGTKKLLTDVIKYSKYHFFNKKIDNKIIMNKN